MGQLSRHGVPGSSLTAAASAPPVRLHDATGQHCPIYVDLLPDHVKTELVQPAEGGQVRGSEGSVKHVEVLQVGELPSSEDLGPLPVGNVTLGVGALSYTGRFELMAVADADGYRDLDVLPRAAATS